MHCRFEGGATKVLRACAGTDLTAAARHGSPSSSSSHASLLRVSGGRLEAAARNLVSCAAISFEALPASSRCSVKAAMRGGRPPPRSAPQAAETSPCIRRCVNVNTTDATTGATALLLPAQNTHTLHDPIRNPECVLHSENTIVGTHTSKCLINPFATMGMIVLYSP